jgi:DNA segregation ATPase FtsK/SpoIIIE-like protein
MCKYKEEVMLVYENDEIKNTIEEKKSDLKFLLLKLISKKENLSINKLQLELSVGFNRALKIKKFLIEQQIINEKGEILLRKRKISKKFK